VPCRLLPLLARAAPPAAPLEDSAPLPRSAARLLLCTVPLAWGTYNPALRLLYSLPHPPSPGELSGTRLLVAVVPYAAALLALAASAAGERRKGEEISGGALATVAASIELGGYNILGTAGQAWGLANTSAVHAAVLLSSINVFVPVLASFTGEEVRPTSWVACALALAGISLLNGASSSEFSVSLGDLSVLAAALAYATYTVRLSVLSRTVPSFPLAAGKTLVLALGCAGWAAAEAAAGWGSHAAAEGSVLWGGAGEAVETRAVGWAIVMFSALLPGSYATWAQARAQSGLSATEAQVVLAATPVVSTLLAAGLLGESLGDGVLAAGGLVLAASLLSAAGQQEKAA